MNEWSQDSLIERTWRDFKGEVPRSRISEVIADFILRYEDAKVKTFLPILIRRQAIDLLNAERELIASSDLTELSIRTSTDSGH